jgi:hypothetical protein
MFHRASADGFRNLTDEHYNFTLVRAETGITGNHEGYVRGATGFLHGMGGPKSHAMMRC